MRKLLIVAAAGAGLLMSSVAASASTSAGTYTHSQGSYALCVTNNVVYSGATQMIQVTLGGLPRQPNGLSSPLGWAATAAPVNGGWAITWTTFGNGVAQNAQLCGFGFKDHGRQLTAPLPLTIAEMTAGGFYCCDYATSTAIRV